MSGGVIFRDRGNGLVVIGAERRIAELCPAPVEFGGQCLDQRRLFRIVTDVAAEQREILLRQPPLLLKDAAVLLFQADREAAECRLGARQRGIEAARL